MEKKQLRTLGQNMERMEDERKLQQQGRASKERVAAARSRSHLNDDDDDREDEANDRLSPPSLYTYTQISPSFQKQTS